MTHVNPSPPADPRLQDGEVTKRQTAREPEGTHHLQRCCTQSICIVASLCNIFQEFASIEHMAMFSRRKTALRLTCSDGSNLKNGENMKRKGCETLEVTLALPSGRTARCSLPQSSKVGDLKALAQQCLEKQFLRLVSAGRILSDSSELLEAAGIQDGDQLTVIARQPPKLAAARHAFAFCGADAVVTWGNPRQGGDSSAVKQQLRSVQQVQATGYAFAAILEDGSVVTWGDPHLGGDSSAVQHQLKNVHQIQATGYAFAAILKDGSVVTWGSPDHGGHSSAVQHQLKNVQQIQATGYAFAAILKDGSVVTWGSPTHGGDRSAVKQQLRSVQRIQATGHAFAAILEDGSVVTWGDPGYGGGSSAIQHQLKNVQQIQATGYAFAAILEDGSAVTWGRPTHGGDSSAVQHQLKNVQRISRPQRERLLRSWKMALWWHGVVQTMVVTALQSNISWRMCSRFRPQVTHLLRSWKMALWWHGGIHVLVVPALQWNSGWGACNKFRPQVPQVTHLLRSLKMALWWHGAIHILAVTALQFKISWGMCSRFRPAKSEHIWTIHPKLRLPAPLGQSMLLFVDLKPKEAIPKWMYTNA